MLEEKIAVKIIDLVKTKEDLLDLEDDIRKVEENLYKNSFNLESLEGKVGEGFFQLLTQVQKEKLLPAKVAEKERLLKSIKEFLESFDQARLTLAFPPSKDFLSKLSHWFGSSVGRPLVLDILVEPEIGGGLILEHAGNYRDYSIAENLDKILSDKAFVTGLLNN